jgi:hypothetical protein
MSYWSYRIGFKRYQVGIVDDKTNKPTGETYEELGFGIVEAYYNENGDIQFTTERFIEPYGETKEELIECLETMLKDVKKHEVLDLDKLWEELGNLSVDNFTGENDERYH